MSQYPAHASPALPPLVSPAEKPHGYRLDFDHHLASAQRDTPSSGPPLVTPAVTPPLTPNGTHADLTSVPISPPPGTSQAHTPQLEGGEQAKLLEKLPEVWCEVRARIPTTTGQEMFLHLYHNNVDNKEHLAIVFGPHIRSRSLYAIRPGETERDRIIRGAYDGTLFPGRTNSRVDALRKEAGVGPRSLVADGGSGKEAATNGSEKTRPLVERGELGPPLVRIHSECYTGETVWSARCDCGEQLDEAARLMSSLETDPDAAARPAAPAPVPSASTPAANPASGGGGGGPPREHHSPYDHHPSLGGAIIYLRQEGRGIGLLAKLQAYNLQDLGADTMQANLLLRHPADARSYGLATAMLLDLGLGGKKGIRLLTNNPDKVRAVEGPGREVRVVERVPMIPVAWRTEGREGVQGKEVERYISTKIEKFKHMFG